MSSSSAHEVLSKFEFYFLALTFTLLGISIQTANLSEVSDAAKILEIAAWVLLLISGIVGLSKLQWVSSLVMARDKKDYYQQMIEALNKSKADGQNQAFDSSSGNQIPVQNNEDTHIERETATSCDLPIVPIQRSLLLYAQDQVHVIAHHGIRADIDGKDRLQFEYPRSDPVTSMGEILSGMRVPSAKKLLPDTAGYAVVSGRRIQRDLILPSLWHVKSAFTIGMRVRDRYLHYNQKTPRILVGIFLRIGCPLAASYCSRIT